MGIEVGGLLGLIWLCVVVWAIIRTAQSRAEPAVKAIWIVLLLVIPVFGFILWLLLGPK